MSEQEYEIVIGIAVATLVFLIIGFFIVILVAYINQRKKKHLEEKQTMQLDFQQEILKSQLEIQEQTFNHISQEIHDNVGQILSLAKVQINIMNESEDLNRQMLDEVKQNVGKALTDLRDMAKSLNSERLRNLSIVEAVRIETERINKTGRIHSTIEASGKEIEINDQIKQILFRIIQECLQNIIKHAQASELQLQFRFNTDKLEVIVNDNGNGFDVNSAISNSSGLGLQNIKSRAVLIGGELFIASILNKGSSITIKIPYE